MHAIYTGFLQDFLFFFRLSGFCHFSQGMVNGLCLA